ncbi:hypothetical protein BRPE64_ACDS25880 [Caballeronia insecticola]|uniref:Uncharacterized protein n=1 Tax=Caballeronia insecticola TaxID=758793 RepID=R4X0D4_9BURK|nr:hypothetical protein BRPE64_ACDS25880 [Caballeronia insecticola]
MRLGPLEFTFCHDYLLSEIVYRLKACGLPNACGITYPWR